MAPTGFEWRHPTEIVVKFAEAHNGVGYFDPYSLALWEVRALFKSTLVHTSRTPIAQWTRALVISDAETSDKRKLFSSSNERVGHLP